MHGSPVYGFNPGVLAGVLEGVPGVVAAVVDSEASLPPALAAAAAFSSLNKLHILNISN